MFGLSNKVLYSGSALFATTTAFIPVWISLALPIRHETVGPYNYHRLAKRAVAPVAWALSSPKPLRTEEAGVAAS
ncbi:hypothetical protein B0A50_08655 [Salinomyces thailandicus]|uniref:Uncharacterized protein n=1 Tax=Salinomyces thailandicus TaxID=706561 RepID=A0A4V5N5H2_9PEZI|nr:hypothetical protein B0A50_08655 [Salinomyces thailandica]